MLGTQLVYAHKATFDIQYYLYYCPNWYTANIIRDGHLKEILEIFLS